MFEKIKEKFAILKPIFIVVGGIIVTLLVLVGIKQSQESIDSKKQDALKKAAEEEKRRIEQEQQRQFEAQQRAKEEQEKARQALERANKASANVDAMTDEQLLEHAKKGLRP